MRGRTLFDGGYRLLVFGGREYKDRDYLFEKLDAMMVAMPIALVIHGAARGADTMAGEWAESRGTPVLAFPVSKAEWKALDWRAGHRRNQRMIDEGRPTLGAGFPGDGGTADMRRRLEKARITTYIFDGVL